jgi:DNA-binding MarR family transcriptional regulator
MPTHASTPVKSKSAVCREDRPADVSASWPPRFVRPLARHFHQICVTAVSDVVAEAGLTLMEFGVLAVLGDLPGIDQNTLADFQVIDRTTVSATVQILEARKLIERGVNEEDRRGRLLYLTKSGEALRARVRPKSLARQQRLLSCLTASERETFVELLFRVVKANEDLARPGSGRRKPSRAVEKQIP